MHVSEAGYGWSAIPRCGQPDNGVLVRAACAKALPAVNVFEEAAYWTASVDSTGRRLTGGSSYVLRFPPGQLPPNDAFWSLTMTDAVGYMVSNSAGRCSFDDRSDLATNADGSIDIYFQKLAPTGHEQNWLPTPAGRFKLMLRAYLPGAAVLDGSYHVPPIVRVVEMNRLIVKYGIPLTIVILLIFAGVVYQRMSQVPGEIITLAVAAGIVAARRGGVHLLLAPHHSRRLQDGDRQARARRRADRRQHAVRRTHESICIGIDREPDANRDR